MEYTFTRDGTTSHARHVTCHNGGFINDLETSLGDYDLRNVQLTLVECASPLWREYATGGDIAGAYT